MESPAKDALPATALSVVTPESVPADGFAPIATAIALVKVGTVLPPASRAATATTKGKPELVAGGCTENASEAAGPTVTLNAVLVAAVSAPEVARIVMPVPSPLRARSLRSRRRRLPCA